MTDFSVDPLLGSAAAVETGSEPPSSAVPASASGSRRRTCLVCGQRLCRAATYCSVRCQQAQQRVLRTAAWLASGRCNPDSSPTHYVRLYLLEQQAGACAICGASSVWHGLPLLFVLDHIDGDASHNARSNLRMICPNCDSQLPTSKGRNKGHGRHARRVRYAAGESY